MTPLAAFISEEGRKVLPFLNQRTQSKISTLHKLLEGGGERWEMCLSLMLCFPTGRGFRINGNSMHVYVDHYVPTDSRGIFKVYLCIPSHPPPHPTLPTLHAVFIVIKQVLRTLFPSHTLDPDLTSYFKSPSSSSSSSSSSCAAVQTLDNVCSLAELPAAALKVKPLARKATSSALARKCKVAPKRAVLHHGGKATPEDEGPALALLLDALVDANTNSTNQSPSMGNGDCRDSEHLEGVTPYQTAKRKRKLSSESPVHGRLERPCKRNRRTSSVTTTPVRTVHREKGEFPFAERVTLSRVQYL